MVCLNCGSGIENGVVCGACGVDNYVFGAVIMASGRLYNDGLKAAQTNDLTAAAECLIKSLEFDKNNCTARNLLGLIYFETGRIGDALKNWVVSSSLNNDANKENNLAETYINTVQRDGRALDKLNDAAKLYNNSITYLKQKNDDMAMIQLKKAVELNPKFVDALNLLTLCYLTQKDRPRAQSLIERALAIDSGNRAALAYAKEIGLSPASAGTSRANMNTGRERPASAPAQGGQRQQNLMRTPGHTLNTRRSAAETFHISEIVSFILGAGICAALLFIMIMPSMLQSRQDEIQKLTANLASVQDSDRAALDRVNADLKAVQDENETLKSQNAAMAQAALVSEYTQKIDKANTLLLADNPAEAANTLYLINVAGAPEELQSQISDLKDEIYPLAATALLESATAEYNAKKYPEAASEINKCLLYIKQDAPNYVDAVWYTGLIAQANGDNETAVAQYNTIVNDYPRYKYVSQAKRNLRNLAAAAANAAH